MLRICVLRAGLRRRLDSIVFLEEPELNSPYLVTAFGGWPDAAKVTTRGMNHLLRQLKARHFAEVNSEEFLNYSQSRPMVVVDSGALNQMRFPSTDFHYWKSETGGHDIILMRGTEPEPRQRTFADTAIKLSIDLGVTRAFVLGGLFHNTPHTWAPRISGSVNTVALKKALPQYGINPVSYRGPGAIQGVLLSACIKAKPEMITLWGHPPFYMRPEPSPRVCMALLEKLGQLLGISIDVEDLCIARAQTERLHTS